MELCTFAMQCNGDTVGTLTQFKEELSADILRVPNKKSSGAQGWPRWIRKSQSEGSSSVDKKSNEKLVRQVLAVEVEAMKGGLRQMRITLQVASRCVTLTSEWKARQKVRVEGLVTIHETSKLLNDDDSFELFKGTLASCTSLIQVQKTNMKTLH